MKITPSILDGCFLIEPEIIRDERGWFSRVFCRDEFLSAGIDVDFIQFNHSHNEAKGTLRGMHYQLPPYAEKKLVRCISGGIVDILLDLRKNSPSFLKILTVELSARNKTAILIPEGVAHGFLSLEDNSDVLYHHSAIFHPESARGIRWNDPQIDLQLPFQPMVISERDKSYPYLDTNFLGISI